MARSASNEILIRFKTAALDTAKKLADDIDRKLKAAARNIKDVAARNKFLGKQAVLQEKRREDIKRQEFSLKQAQQRDAAPDRVDLRARGNKLREGLGKVDRVLDVANAGNLAGALQLFGKLPGVFGPVAALASAVAAVVLPLLQKEMEARLKGIENRIALRQEQAFLRSDVPRRFREDPDFRDRLVREAVEDEIARDRAARGGAWRRGGRYTVPE